MELSKPKDRRHNFIKGTQKRDLPKLFSRKEFTFLIRMFTEAGAIPISEECKGMRFDFGGYLLSKNEKRLFFKHADLWQKILLEGESDRVTTNRDSTNTLVVNSTDGLPLRDTQDNTSRPKKTYENLQRRS